MRWFRNSRFARSVLFPLTLIMWLSACQKTVISVSPYDDIAREEPGMVTVVFEDGSTTNIHRPWIAADSLFGVDYDPRTRAYTDTVSFAFAETSRVERVVTPTALKVFGIVAGVAVVAGMVALAVKCSDQPCFAFGSD